MEEPAAVDVPTVPEVAPVVDVPEEAPVEAIAKPTIVDTSSNTPATSGEEVVEPDPYYTYLGTLHSFGTINNAITSATSVVASGSVMIYVEGNAIYTENVTIDGSSPTGNKINGLTGTLVSGNFPISRAL